MCLLDNLPNTEGASFGDIFEDIRESYSNILKGVFSWLVCICPLIFCTEVGNDANWNCMSQVVSLDSSVIASYMLETPILP